MDKPSADVCLACPGPYMDGPAPNYDHIHQVDDVPRAKRTDAHIVRRGYAVGMSGQLPQMWVFFEHLEPALVFGRAGRMSLSDISGWGIYEAANEVRFDPKQDRDVKTLYVDMGSSPDDGFSSREDEADVFARWIKGCDPKLSYFSPPPR